MELMPLDSMAFSTIIAQKRRSSRGMIAPSRICDWKRLFFSVLLNGLYVERSNSCRAESSSGDGEPLVALLGTVYRRAVGMAGDGAAVEVLENQLFRSVVHAGDLFEHHLFFLFDLVGRKDRIAAEIGQEVETEMQVLTEAADAEAGLFLGGPGVDVAAGLFDAAGDLDVVALLRTLEQRVLDEVRHPFESLRIFARSGIDPQPEGDAMDRWHLIADDAQAVGEGSTFDGSGREAFFGTGGVAAGGRYDIFSHDCGWI